MEVGANPERAALEALYLATDGPNWTNNANWLSDAPISDWYGVRTDDLGFVETLALSGNGLNGPLPPELGDLVAVRNLQLMQNQLGGALPPELGKLTGLRALHLHATDLSGEIPPELGNLASLETLDLFGNHLSGEIPPELGELPSLKALFLFGNELSGTIPPALGNIASLEVAFLHFNRLEGSIPPELGRLSNLNFLDLSDNRLTGAIPPAMGDLVGLEALSLRLNGLEGAIPPELGNLPGLKKLDLSDNHLEGAIPPELGNLAGIEEMFLFGNRLSGPLPPPLGGLVNLKALRLHSNELEGPLPAELGSLIGLESLYLNYNALSGPIPPDFGALANLRELDLSGNAEMSGALPDSIVNLRLDALWAGGTDLCTPRDSVFVDWIESIPRRLIGFCEGGEPAYLTQAVQSQAYPVPLLADRKALLRVFVTAREQSSEGIPLVRATFFLDGTEETLDIPGKSTPIPTEIDEGDLSKSANIEVPGRLVQPGLEMVIDIDPAGELDDDLGVPKRIPATGRMALDVEEMPVLDLTVVPFLWTEDPDSAVLDHVADMERDPEGSVLLQPTRVLLPVADLDLEVHDPVETNTNNGFELRDQTKAIRALEGGTGYWMGMMTGLVTGGALGVAEIPGWASFSIPDSIVIAHELGHNMNLWHAPGCLAGGPDRRFPQPDGSIGAWGYDFQSGGRLVQPGSSDLMTYCEQRWISDYHFSNAFRHRLDVERDVEALAHRTPEPSLLVWGGTTPLGDLFLHPAIMVDASAALPLVGGDHRITGLTADSAEAFSLDFEMTKLSKGGSSFAFVLPLRPGWTDSLARVTLSGPDGEATLDGYGDRPLAIVRDSRTGRVRSVLWDESALEARARLADEPGVVVRFSRGIPAAVRRR